MLYTDFTDLSSTEPELLLTEVPHCDNWEFCVFCCCDLDLDPYLQKISLSKSRPSKITILHTDRETYRRHQTHYHGALWVVNDDYFVLAVPRRRLCKVISYSGGPVTSLIQNSAKQMFTNANTHVQQQSSFDVCVRLLALVTVYLTGAKKNKLEL